MLAVTTASYRININDVHNEILKAKRGLRQGNSLPPLLFVIVMEYLNRILQRLNGKSDFNYHSKFGRIQLINLYFADDLLLFSRGNKKSVQMVMDMFAKFSKSTGLKVNPSKCKIYFGGVDSFTRDGIKQITRFDEGTVLFRYLIVPHTSKKLYLQHCMVPVDRIMIRIMH